MISLASLSMKGLTGHWTKWGGGVHDIFGSQNSLIGDESLTWFCQSCNKEIPKELQPYFYEYPEGEYMKVCAICVHEDCKVLKQRIEIIDTTVIQSGFDEFNS